MENLSFNFELQTNTEATERVKSASKKKEIATKQITWVELWDTGYETATGKRKAGIFQTKITELDRKRLLEVKHAIEVGELGVGVPDLKKFSKSHALNLYRELRESRKGAVIADMIAKWPENYHLVTTAEQFNHLIGLLKQEDYIGLDTETNGLRYFHGDNIVGLSMSLPKADYHCYIPLRHNVPEAQLDAKGVFDWLKPFLEDENLGKILHNAKFDYHMFTNEGIYIEGIIMDTMIAMTILSENELSYALKNLATKYGKHFGFEEPSMTYEELFGKGGFENTPLDIGCIYACKDTELVIRFREWILSHMNKQPKLHDVYHKEENEVLAVSIDMEQNGFEIDLDFAGKYAEELRKQVGAMEAEIKEVFGDINVASNVQLATKIYDEWKVSEISDAMVDGSEKLVFRDRAVDAKRLKKIMTYEYKCPQVAGIKVLLEYRKLEKLLSTYIEPLPDKIGLDGRLHGQFNQSKTVTGRYASAEPNLQNLPKEARKMIVAPEGKIILGIDFSQIEPRILAHITGDEEFSRPYVEGTDIYATLASKTFKVPIENCGDGSTYRKAMKMGLLATMYGTSTFTLGQQIGISQAEAEAFIADFLSAYPVVKGWIESIHDFVDKEGYVETLYGRKRRFMGHKDIASRYKAVCKTVMACNNGEMPTNIWACKNIPYKVRQAYWAVASDYGRVSRQSVNAIIQGTGAQIMKRAMVGVNNQLKLWGPEYKMIATIHDELMVEVPETITVEQVEQLENIMMNCVKLDIELKVDTEVMARWGAGVGKKEWVSAGCGREVFKNV